VTFFSLTLLAHRVDTGFAQRALGGHVAAATFVDLWLGVDLERLVEGDLEDLVLAVDVAVVLCLLHAMTLKQ
jgi:hypothetical protein